jgi:hypothetical protein
MFQISTAPSGRKAASALTVLAAIGASGMVAEVSSAAVVELEPMKAARGLKSSYMGTSNPENWLNWQVSEVTYHVPPNGPGFATWDIDFNAGAITNAKYRIDANNNPDQQAYGLPAGCTLNFSLVTEPWDPGTPDANQFGPDHGTTPGVDSLDVVDTLGNDFDADITPLLLTWQLNPTSYYGVRFAVTGGADRGGVNAPGGAVTANLLLTQGTAAVPEPTCALAALAFGGLCQTQRRRR